mmetsp:Transcript_17616/g.38161  ORF Transcript_17616/g.38161 Transcript_17616/m.38161 type:complete len:217 (+) Transcript_17616:2720-3370(+)
MASMVALWSSVRTILKDDSAKGAETTSAPASSTFSAAARAIWYTVTIRPSGAAFEVSATSTNAIEANKPMALPSLSFVDQATQTAMREEASSSTCMSSMRARECLFPETLAFPSSVLAESSDVECWWWYPSSLMGWPAPVSNSSSDSSPPPLSPPATTVPMASRASNRRGTPPGNENPFSSPASTPARTSASSTRAPLGEFHPRSMPESSREKTVR